MGLTLERRDYDELRNALPRGCVERAVISKEDPRYGILLCCVSRRRVTREGKYFLGRKYPEAVGCSKTGKGIRRRRVVFQWRALIAAMRSGPAGIK